MSVSEKNVERDVRAMALHAKLRGKISIVPKTSLRTLDDLSLSYTPGVAAVSSHLARHPEDVRRFTMKWNAVAVVSDGSAVLGLGNIGPEGALPVMEGKAMLFKALAGVDAFPIVLARQDTDAVVETIANIAPVFGGINLEDISSPRCFEIETRLKKLLDIPVMHDDQHGTAIATLAGLLNALKVTKKKLERSTVVILGAGAAGTAIAHLLHRMKTHDIIVVDSRGIVVSERKNLPPHKKKLAAFTNRKKLSGDFSRALLGADVVVGVSGSARLAPSHIQSMGGTPIVLALSNPTPEIFPKEARQGGALCVATGRSDFPNQINNALVFPGVFRGALDHSVRAITDEMRVKAAKALAGIVTHPTPRYFMPKIFDRRVVAAVAGAIR